MRVTAFFLLAGMVFGALGCDRAPDPFEAYLKVAEVEIGKGRYERAEEALSTAIDFTALEDRRRNLALAGLFRRLGHEYRFSRKDPSQSVLNYQRALFITSKLDPKHPNIPSLYLELGQVYTDLGDYPKAETFMREALSRQGGVSKNVEDLRVILGNLARVCDKQGKYTEAERLYLREISIMEANLEKHHLYKVWIAYPLAYLGEIYRKQGRTQEAEAHFVRSLAVMREGKLDSSSVPETMENYARLLRQTGRAQDAEGLEVEAKARRARFGKEPM